MDDVSATEQTHRTTDSPHPGASISRNFALLALAAVGNRLFALVLGLAIARSLGPSEYGVYTLAAAIVLGIVAITELGLPPYTTREVARDRTRFDSDLRRIVGLRIALGLLGLIVVTVWLAWTPGSEVARAVLILYLAMSLEAGFFLGVAYLQGLETMRFEALTSLVGGLCRTVGGIVLLIAFGSLNYVLGWMVLVALAQAGAVTVRVARERRGRPTRSAGFRPFREVVTSAGAMMVVVVCNAVILRADTVIIGWFLDVADVGIYTAAYALVTGLQIIPAILAIAVFPVFSRTFGRDPAGLRSTWAGALRAAVLTTVPAAMIAAVLAEPLIARFYGAPYSSSAAVLAVLIWWVPPAAFTALSAALLRAAGRERSHALILIVGATVNVTANVVVIPIHGIVGAAWVTVSVEVCMALATLLVIRGIGAGGPEPWRLARALPAMAGLIAAAVILRPLPVEVAVIGAIAVFAGLAIAFRAVAPAELSGLARSLSTARTA